MPEPSPEAVEALFQQATDLDPAQRGAFLDEQCAGDPDLRAAVEELLALRRQGRERARLFAQPGRRRPRGDCRCRRSLGCRLHIGRYRILRRHGEGGMGTVYEAEQDNPRRTVALKVIRPGSSHPSSLKRFNHEAQILARLQHSGIAQVYEAGIGEDGQPFFAMEFIRGMPLDEYARSRGLDAAARLELLARVCDAVQHAHEKGVIHRDLKPGNILVDETGQPKVLDFGVAHVTAADLLTTASRTQAGQLLGTLSYMSPEQIAADPAGLDGRSDVYTLGVILFELLAHRLPYQLDQLPVHEVARVIQEQEPSRLGSIDTLYRGDVEIIVGQGARERQDAALRLGGRPGVGHQALPAGGSDPGPARVGACISSASSLGGTRRWWPGRRASSRRSWWEPSFRSSLPCVPRRTLGWRMRTPGWRTKGSVPPHIKATVPGSRPRLPRFRITTLPMPPASSRRPRSLCATGNGDTCTPGSTTARPCFPAVAGESQFLIHDPKGIRIAAWTPASLRLSDLEGNELLTRSFPA